MQANQLQANRSACNELHRKSLQRNAPHCSTMRTSLVRGNNHVFNLIYSYITSPPRNVHSRIIYHSNTTHLPLVTCRRGSGVVKRACLPRMPDNKRKRFPCAVGKRPPPLYHFFSFSLLLIERQMHPSAASGIIMSPMLLPRQAAGALSLSLSRHGFIKKPLLGSS